MSGTSSTSSSSSSRTSSSSGGGGSHEGGSASVTISREGVEAGVGDTSVSVGEHSAGMAREFELWKAPRVVIPTGVPGINLTLGADAKAQVNGSVNFEHATEVTVGGSVTGSATIGLEGGAPPLASLYLRGGPRLSGSLSLTLDRQGLKSVTGRIDLNMAARVGVDIGGGALDYGIDLGSARMCSFVGISYDRTRAPRFQNGTFELGPSLRSALDWAKAAADRAVSLGSAAVSTIRNAMSGAASSIASGASAAYEWMTSW